LLFVIRYWRWQTAKSKGYLLFVICYLLLIRVFVWGCLVSSTILGYCYWLFVEFFGGFIIDLWLFMVFFETNK